MNKLKCFLWIIVLILLATGVQGLNEVAYYQLGNLTDNWNTFDMINTGSTNSTEYPTYNTTGNGTPNSRNFNGAIPHKTESEALKTNISKNKNFSISLWINVTDFNQNANVKFIVNSQIANNDAFGFSYRNSDLKTSIWNGAAFIGVKSGALTDNDWHHVVYTFNTATTTGNLYIDTIAQAGGNSAGSVNGQTGTAIGSRLDTTRGLTGNIDTFKVYEGVLNQTEVENLYNCNNVTSCGGSPPGDTLNITGRSPGDNVQYNSNPILFNVTVDSTLNFNCSLLINGSINQTKSAGLGVGVTLDFNVTMGGGEWNWIFNCTNGNDTEVTSSRILYVDVVNPIITVINSPKGKVFYQNNLTGQWNFTDNFYLHSYNITIDGSQIDYKNEINATVYIYNLSYDVTALSPNDYSLGVRVCDGHTAGVLGGDYEVSDGFFERYLKYEFWDEGEVKIKGLPDSIFDEFTTTRRPDKYTFTYEPSDILSEYNFEVESDMLIHIIDKPGSKYGDQWLIMGEHWMDFRMPEEPNMTLEITRINDYKVNVQISGLEHPELQKFSSIGDLNCVQKNYTFSVANGSITYDNYSFESDEETFTFSLNKTAGVSSTASFYWNDSLKASTKNAGSLLDVYSSTFDIPLISALDQNISFYWLYNLTAVNNSEAGNVSGVQRIYRMSIDNCSVYSAHAVNFSLFDETTSLPLVGSIGATFRVFRSDSLVYRTESFDFSGSNNYSICIYPAWASYFLSSVAFEYTAPSYTTEEYMISSLSISNTTEEIGLYLVNESLSEYVVLTLRDTDDNTLEGYTIRINRFYPATGEEITTEIVQTDYTGVAVASLVLYDVYYTFSIEKDSVVYELIPPVKIYTTSKVFIIDISATELSFDNKVFYETSPDSPVLPTIVSFSLTTASPGNYIEWYSISTSFNGSFYEDNNSEVGGGTALISLNLTGQEGWLTIDYFIKASDEGLFGFEQGYYVSNVTPGNYSAEGIKADWEAEFNPMWRIVLAVFISIVMVLVFVNFTGIEVAGTIGLFIQIGFVIYGWIPLWMMIIEAVIMIGIYLMYERGAA